MDYTGYDSVAEDGIHLFNLEERVALVEDIFMNASSGLVTAVAHVEQCLLW